MSDYIDELVAKHFPCSPDGGCCDTDHDRDCRFYDAMRLARAVAERVRERAMVCGECYGEGKDPSDVSVTCPICRGRGVTFGGEA